MEMRGAEPPKKKKKHSTAQANKRQKSGLMGQISDMNELLNQAHEEIAYLRTRIHRLGQENHQLSHRLFQAEADLDQSRASAAWQQSALRAELAQLKQVARDRGCDAWKAHAHRRHQDPGDQ